MGNNHKTIAFIPLDSRPCTYDFPVQLGRLAGAEILIPPTDMIGVYKGVTDTRALSEWLEKTAPECDAVVVSAEQLLQGGLIPSRLGLVNAEQQFELLKVLERIKQNKPEIVIYLSTILMRTSISTLGPESLIWWEKVNSYSQLYYREKACNDEEAAEKCRVLEKEIPASVLETFFQARKVSHEVNRRCIRLAAEGTVQEVLIAQEDCTPEGIHRFEQEILLEDIRKYQLEDKVFMFNGTDEAGTELLQKAIHPEGCTVDVVWLRKQTDFVASYEDRSFAENIEGHMRAMNMEIQSGAKRVLCIVPPKAKQGEASVPRTGLSQDYTEKELAQICDQIVELTEQGRYCYLLDVDFANGGNVALLELLGQKMAISKLYGYSAWNTASNALGTLLAQIAADNGENSKLNQAFTAERILDDGIYQTIVRQLVTVLVKESGQDIYNIERVEQANKWLKQEFQAQTSILEHIFGGNVPDFCVQLRWNRLFEAAVFTFDGNGPVWKGK